jgi:hypothetical protein
MLKSVDKRQSHFVSKVVSVTASAQTRERWISCWPVQSASPYIPLELDLNVFFDTNAMFTSKLWKILNPLLNQHQEDVKKGFLECKLV